MPLSLAVKHQLMIGYHLWSPHIDKPIMDVSDVSTVPLDFFEGRDTVAQSIKQRDPDLSEIHLPKIVWSKGRHCRTGMV